MKTLGELTLELGLAERTARWAGTMMEVGGKFMADPSVPVTIDDAQRIFDAYNDAAACWLTILEYLRGNRSH